MKQKTNEKITANILCLEDAPQDVEIIRELLTDAGFKLKMDWAATETEFVSLLRGNKYDIILSDFRLPGFDAFGALRLSLGICPDVPFICVSGSIGEETAIELIKQGAVDYILKDRLVRLPSAIKRALDEVEEKETRRHAEEALSKSEQRFQVLAENSPVGIFQTDTEGSTIYVNPRWCQISGLSKEEALGNGWFSAVHSEDKEKPMNPRKLSRYLKELGLGERNSAKLIDKKAKVTIKFTKEQLKRLAKRYGFNVEKEEQKN